MACWMFAFILILFWSRPEAVRGSDGSAAGATKKASSTKIASTAEASTKASTKKISREASPAPRKVPGKLQAYQAYVKANFAAVSEAHPGLKLGDISKMLGASWKQLGEAEKAAYLPAAAEGSDL